MMKQVFLYSILMLLFSAGGLQGCSDTPDTLPDPGDPDRKEELTSIFPIHGICRQNLQWVNNSKTVEIANNIVKSDIPVVRINGVKEDGSIDQVIHSINIFADRGVKVLLIQPMWMEMFPLGYQKVPGPNFKLYRMADIDLVRFRSYMNELLKQIALRTSKDALIG
ncbi:hypothetical protein G5B35_24085, partial [Parapusillimonas sp. SGNA-6]|nr:hypothetical protein [Parapusillimonas sp. SGNA-6]